MYLRGMGEEPSDYAKWQHAENVLVGYRARASGESYDPPASPGSAREFSYRAGWKVACFDLGAKWLREAGKLYCRVTGEDDTAKMSILGGTDFERWKGSPGMYTGRTFMVRFDDEGNVVAGVTGQGQMIDEKVFEVDGIETLGQVVDAAVDHVMEVLGCL